MVKLTLQSVRQEAGNVKTFIFNTEGLSWQAGQYQTYTLPEVEGDDATKQRYFTIASAPSEGEVHISTRIPEATYISAFKRRLNGMQPGDTIEADSIDGDFTWGEDSQPVVFVAGGIGITPFRSILLDRASKGRPLNVHLLYYGRDDQFAFRDEFSELIASHPELVISYIVGEHVSADSIFNHAPEVATQLTYLSGPEPMVDSVGGELQNRGVNLKQDWLPGYDDNSY